MAGLDEQAVGKKLEEIGEPRREQVGELVGQALDGAKGEIRRPAPRSDQFRDALTRLANDSDFRARATERPELIVEEFKLDLVQLQALRDVAALSGADLTAVNLRRAALMVSADVGGMDWATNIDGVEKMLTENGIDHIDAASGGTSVSVSCCSCCCCCCGETAVLQA